MRARQFFYRETLGIRVTVRPRYLGRQSAVNAGRHVFAYYVRIENVGAHPVRLLTRRWRIHDAAGEDLEVTGDGVVGQQPTIAAGAVHEYSSFCVLTAPAGHMEGSYGMARMDGSRFDVLIPRFDLRAGHTGGS